MATQAHISGKTSVFQSIRERLSQSCESTFSKTESKSAECIETGDFHIDLDSRSATVRGQELHLNRAEFDVLVFVTSHKKQVITPQTNLATRTAGTTVCQTEFLPALLSLRKKLQEAVPDVQYIRTEFWMLYDFQPSS